MTLGSGTMAVVLLVSVGTMSSGAAQPPLIHLTFDEDLVENIGSSPTLIRPEVIGNTISVPGINNRGLSLDGQSYVRLLGTENWQPRSFTISLWAQGTSREFFMRRGQPGVRAPHFQVTGERIHLAASGDYRPRGGRPAIREGVDNARGLHPLFTGVADIALSAWSYRHRDVPSSCLEPKLQVVRGSIHYECFGQTEDGNWEIFTGNAGAEDGSFHLRPQTKVQAGYGVEQMTNIQVVGSRVYGGFPLKRNDGWTLSTASWDTDGSGWKTDMPLSESEGNGWIPSIQAYGDRVYYLFTKVDGNLSSKPDKKFGPATFLFASTDLDGGDWKIIREVAQTDFHTGSVGAFRISDGRVYLSYPKFLDRSRERTGLFTASMNIDGSDFQETMRVSTPGFVIVGHNSLQVVGDYVYYTYGSMDTRRSISDYVRAMHDLESVDPLPANEYRWTWQSARARIDGSDWTSKVRLTGRPWVEAPFTGYRGIQVVGAKTYLSGNYSVSAPGMPQRWQGALGSAGSNIIAKGDSVGIGLTEEGDARAFINAGDGYLYRGEAPSNTSGTTVDAATDNAWHNYALTFDGSSLHFYVDGDLVGTRAYQQAPGNNDFPILIGDSFEGVVDEVEIWDNALPSQEVKRRHQESREQFKTIY